MTKAVLWLLDRIAWLFRYFSIDYPAMRAIVEVKLIAENRRLHGLGKKHKAYDDNKKTFIRTLLVQVLFSFIYGLGFFFVKQHVFNMMLMSFAFIMFMICFNMISDFIEVLFDTNDNVILLPKPIDSRTLWAARLIHIMVFLGILTIANSVGLIIFTSIKLGISVGILFFFFVLLLCVLTVFLSSLLYLGLIKIIPADKLRDLMIYMQIFFTIGLSVGYQFIARVNKTSITALDELSPIHDWYYLAPPAWFAAGIDSFVHEQYTPAHIMLWMMLILMPFVALFLLNRYLAPLFSKTLSAITFGETLHSEPNKTLGNRIGIFTFFSYIFTKNIIEKAAFELVWKIISRDRRFKLRIYPTFGMLLYFLYKYYNDHTTPNVSRLLALYYSTFTLYVIAQQIFVSDDWKAAWIYRVAPVTNPGEILTGAYKAVVLKHILPLYVVVTLALLYHEGIAVLDDIFLNISVTLMYISVGVFQVHFKLPFSTENDTATRKSANMVRILVMFVVMPVMGFVHFFVAQTLAGTIVVGTGFYMIAVILFRQYRYIAWDRIKA